MSDNDNDSATTESAAASSAPLLRVVRGNPTDEEVAVLVTLVAAASGSSGADADPGPRNDWGRPQDRLRPAWGAPTSFFQPSRW